MRRGEDGLAVCVCVGERDTWAFSILRTVGLEKWKDGWIV